jgi:hypothetical protein
MNRELDRRNEELSSLGWVPPQTDYTFPPARLLEDDRSNNGHMATSHTGRSDHVNQANTRIVEDSIPSVASTTLRGDSSRARKNAKAFSKHRGLTSCKTSRMTVRDLKARGESLTSIATSHTIHKVPLKVLRCRSGLELDFHLHLRSPVLSLRRADIFNHLLCHIRVTTSKQPLYIDTTAQGIVIGWLTLNTKTGAHGIVLEPFTILPLGLTTTPT